MVSAGVWQPRAERQRHLGDSEAAAAVMQTRVFHYSGEQEERPADRWVTRRGGITAGRIT